MPPSVDVTAICDEFRRIVENEEADLAKAALVIARLEYPDLDPAHSLSHLEALAAAVRERLSPGAPIEERVAAINVHLFLEQRFRGAEDNYYDPRNSCLNAVLERKIGIPITLSLIYMEVAGRLGLAVDGISFPGHFLVRVRCDQGLVVLDPFNRGETLTEDEVRRRLARVHGQAYAETVELAEVLAPASRREILVRMLRNLKKIYVEGGETDKAIATMSLALIADPGAVAELRDRGLLYREIEAYRAALADLSRYLERLPGAADADAIRYLVAELRAINARLH